MRETRSCPECDGRMREEQPIAEKPRMAVCPSCGFYQ